MSVYNKALAMMSDPKKYLLVIHTGELKYPLMDVANNLGWKINKEGRVESDRLMEITQLGRAGSGISLSKAQLTDIHNRHLRGEEIAGIVGCPLLTAEVIRQLDDAGVPIPQNTHLVTMMPPDDYKIQEGDFPGITRMVETAKTATNLFDDPSGLECAVSLITQLAESLNAVAAGSGTVPAAGKWRVTPPMGGHEVPKPMGDQKMSGPR